MKSHFVLFALILPRSLIGVAQEKRSFSEWKDYVYSENAFAITLPSDPSLTRARKWQMAQPIQLHSPMGRNFRFTQWKRTESALKLCGVKKRSTRKTRQGPRMASPVLRRCPFKRSPATDTQGWSSYRSYPMEGWITNAGSVAHNAYMF